MTDLFIPSRPRARYQRAGWEKGRNKDQGPYSHIPIFPRGLAVIVRLVKESAVEAYSSLSETR